MNCKHLKLRGPCASGHSVSRDLPVAVISHQLLSSTLRWRSGSLSQTWSAWPVMYLSHMWKKNLTVGITVDLHSQKKLKRTKNYSVKTSLPSSFCACSPAFSLPSQGCWFLMSWCRLMYTEANKYRFLLSHHVQTMTVEHSLNLLHSCVVFP